MHLCDRQMNFTKRTCCQLVLLLNDTTRVPLCDVEFLAQDDNSSIIYKPPVFLDEPLDVHEDHATFLVGIALLMLVAFGCIFTLSRVIKPRFSLVTSECIANYDFMMWMPPKSNQGSSMLVCLRGMTCRPSSFSERHSNISAISSNVRLLPTYRSVTSTPISSAFSSFPPPPPYAERQRLTDDEVV
ncbi:hypothetical protein KIN20_010946 [Parelaphostrongylus tenuis]|uniref:Uncharacterized protein n=1 Tax=Parelaphostrongylus tenuis TaxID=148309 RepID=A0AAD5MU82_PARTN|nr:hypothetical protein KIN20_010946 [Parelaphostrongylus tenuis]